jgi:hypothetical protein
MKNFIIIVSVLILTSCGALNEMCGSDLRMGCNTVFGKKSKNYDQEFSDSKKKDEEQDQRLDKNESNILNLTNRIKVLEISSSNFQSFVTNTTVDISEIENLLSNLENEILSIPDHTAKFEELESLIGQISNRVTILEDSEVAGTETDQIVSFYDLCGNSKEILLVFESGKILGYFEHGSKRYLSLLEDGNYESTDGEKCKFKIEDSEIIEL